LFTAGVRIDFPGEIVCADEETLKPMPLRQVETPDPMSKGLRPGKRRQGTMTESWQEKLTRLKKKREEDEDAQADAQKIASELPEIRGKGNVAIMIPSRRRKGGEGS